MYLMALGPICFKWKMLSLSGQKALLFLQLLIVLLTRSVMNVCAISNDFHFVSLVTNRFSLEEVCLPSFDVLNCWLNMAASCLDDENEFPLKIIASFSIINSFNGSAQLGDIYVRKLGKVISNCVHGVKYAVVGKDGVMEWKSQAGLLYADDVCLMANSEEDMKVITEKVNEYVVK